METCKVDWREGDRVGVLELLVLVLGLKGEVG